MIKKETLPQLTSELALQKLIDGNFRFQKGEDISRGFVQENRETAVEQYRYTIILGCFDSRVPVEILFDQGVGDLFVTRIAGNFENENLLACFDFIV